MLPAAHARICVLRERCRRLGFRDRRGPSSRPRGSAPLRSGVRHSIHCPRCERVPARVSPPGKSSNAHQGGWRFRHPHGLRICPGRASLRMVPASRPCDRVVRRGGPRGDGDADDHGAVASSLYPAPSVVLEAPVASRLMIGNRRNAVSSRILHAMVGSHLHRLNRRRLTFMRKLVLCLVIILAILAAPAVASAHAVLASSQPRAGERLGTAPGVVVLEFTEPVNPKLSSATVTDPTGRRFTGGVSEGQEIRVPLSTNASGVYTVDWVSVSTLDGHSVRGSFQFGVGVTPAGGSVETAQ